MKKPYLIIALLAMWLPASSQNFEEIVSGNQRLIDRFAQFESALFSDPIEATRILQESLVSYEDDRIFQSNEVLVELGTSQEKVLSYYRAYLTELKSNATQARVRVNVKSVYYNRESKKGLVSFDRVLKQNNEREERRMALFVEYKYSNGFFRILNIRNPDRCSDSTFALTINNDTDLLSDEMDLCPKLEGPIAFGGCPDSDGDGLSDDVDLCPNKVGLKKDSGCPDSDQDGVYDDKDLCANTSYKYNVDSNGCPVDIKDNAVQNTMVPPLYSALIPGLGHYMLPGVKPKRPYYLMSVAAYGALIPALVNHSKSRASYNSYLASTNYDLAQPELQRARELADNSKIWFAVAGAIWVGDIIWTRKQSMDSMKKSDLTRLSFQPNQNGISLVLHF